MNRKLDQENYFCNLKLKNSEFCSMWGCSRFDQDCSCTMCSVIKDLSKMAKAYHIDISSLEMPVMKAA